MNLCDLRNVRDLFPYHFTFFTQCHCIKNRVGLVHTFLVYRENPMPRQICGVISQTPRKGCYPLSTACINRYVASGSLKALTVVLLIRHCRAALPNKLLEQYFQAELEAIHKICHG